MKFYDEIIKLEISKVGDEKVMGNEKCDERDDNLFRTVSCIENYDEFIFYWWMSKSPSSHYYYYYCKIDINWIDWRLLHTQKEIYFLPLLLHEVPLQSSSKCN